MNILLHPLRPIMIVDDQASILLAIDTTLQMAGLSNTVTCQDSRRVMDMLAENPVELMLLDLNMPNIDGHRLLDDVSRDYPDIPVIIVTGLDDTVFSDTLFGHVKGAFTGADTPRGGLIEQAAGGTLFLDEIGDLPQASQVKLLRLLQEGEYFPLGADVPRSANARIIAATNQRLSVLLDEGRFRKDLNYRLQTHRIYIPPLRDRRDDIPQLLDHFLASAASRLNKPTPSVPRELLPMMTDYAYPGNVRELESMIFDAVSRHRSGVLSLESLNSHITREQSADRAALVSPNTDTDPPITFSHRLPTIKQATTLLVEEAMHRSGGNQSRAAKILGISQQALSKRLKKDAG